MQSDSINPFECPRRYEEQFTTHSVVKIDSEMSEFGRFIQTFKCRCGCVYEVTFVAKQVQMKEPPNHLDRPKLIDVGKTTIQEIVVQWLEKHHCDSLSYSDWDMCSCSISDHSEIMGHCDVICPATCVPDGFRAEAFEEGSPEIKPGIDIEEILAEWLEENGFHGLYSSPEERQKIKLEGK